jgi:hypothetical protein
MSTRAQLVDSIHELVKLIFTSRFFYATIAFVVVLCLAFGQDEVRDWISALSGWVAAMIAWPTINLLKTQIVLPTLERKLQILERRAQLYTNAGAIVLDIQKNMIKQTATDSALLAKCFDELIALFLQHPTITNDVREIMLDPIASMLHSDADPSCPGAKDLIQTIIITINDYKNELIYEQIEIEARIDRLTGH